MKSISIVEDKKYIHMIHTCIAILKNLLEKKELLSSAIIETISDDLTYINYCYERILKGKKLKYNDKENLMFYYKDYTYKFEKILNLKENENSNYERLIFNKFNLLLVSNFNSLVFDYLKLIKDEESIIETRFKLKILKKYTLQILEMEKSVKNYLNSLVKNVEENDVDKFEIEIDESEIDKIFTPEDLVKLQIIEDYIEDNTNLILGNVRVQQLNNLERNIEKNNIILNMLKENQIND